MLHRALDGEAVVVAQLVKPHHLASEHGRQGARADRVAPFRREAGRVVGRVQHRPVLDVLGEHGERAPIVVEAGRDQPVVRNEPLELRREIGQEFLRIEGVLHRAADGSQTGHQIGENDVGLVRGIHPIDDTTNRRFDFRRAERAGPTV